jgi:hypothetical protein
MRTTVTRYVISAFTRDSDIAQKFLTVTGCLLHLVAAELYIQAANRSVIFLKERDLVLTSDYWRIAIDVNVEPYEEAILTIKEDSLTAEKQRK